MKTKTTLAAFAAITALAFCSCQKNTSEGPVKETLSEGQAELKLNITTDATKTTSRSDEWDKAIDSVAIMIFNDLSELENLYVGSVDSQGKLDASIRTSMGTKTVMAFANGSTVFRDKLRQIRQMDDVDSLKSDLKEDNTTESFLMKGRKDNVDVNSASFNIDMEVSRIVARVEIHKVTNAITSETDNTLTGKYLTISSIYIINAAGEYSFGSTSSTPETWYNMLESDGIDQELFGDIAFDAYVKRGKSYEADHYFYTYPNNCTNFDCTDEEWCPRPTRLVVECVFGEDDKDDITCYYSFNIPDGKNPDMQTLCANTTYSITSFTITRRGSTSPWEDIPVGSASISISVKNWQTGESYEYTI